MRQAVAGLMKLGLTRKGKPMLKELDNASRQVQISQQNTLENIISYAQNTAYGKEHGFSHIQTPKDFQAAVPVNTYEDLRPYIDRHQNGEENVLFPGKPMFYATTSGTTSAPKRIPITQKYHDECYNGLSNLWLYTMFKENPGFMNGYDISMVGKTVEGYTKDGTSYGSFSGHMNSYMPDFVKKFRVIPFAVHDMAHYPSKYYAIMRVALSYPITWIVAANPSTLLELHRFACMHWDEILKDINDGTLSRNIEISDAIRHSVESRLRPNPKRARFLESLMAGNGQCLPKDYWPTLKVINTWKCGNARLYLEQTRGYYSEHTAIREFGYIATEARAGIILENNQEASILAAHLLFFEFVHKSELEHQHPTYLFPHQLEQGEEYGIYITTPSGLYRYNMNDIVRVEGFYNTFPMVRFMQKGAGATSLTGEKLYESQYLSAVKRVLSQHHISSSFHIAFADFSTSSYKCFMEFSEIPEAEVISQVANQVDQVLQEDNPEYYAKRKSNRLSELTIHLLAPGAFLKYKSQRLEEGDREGQFKLTHLQQNAANLELFKTLILDNGKLNTEVSLDF